MRETGLQLTDEARFNEFTGWIRDQIDVHGTAIGYRALEGPNTLFDFIASFDSTYRHPVGEVISKVREFASMSKGFDPELLAKAGAWLFLIYNDLMKKGEMNGPTQNRAGSISNSSRSRRRSKR